MNLFSVISVLDVGTSQGEDSVSFGSDFSQIRMDKKDFLSTVPRNNHQMVLLELSKGILAFNKTSFSNIQTIHVIWKAIRV